MAGAQPQLHPIGGDYLQHGAAGHLVGRCCGQLCFEALAGCHVWQAQVESVVGGGTTAALLQGIDSLPQGHAPLHQRFDQQQGCKGRIPLWQMHAEAHAARFFAAHQHLAAQHLCSDVFEAHGLFQHLALQAFCHKLHQVGAAYGFDYAARQLAGPGQVVDE